MPTYDFTIRVTDSLGAQATRLQQVVIDGTNPTAASLLQKLWAWYDFEDSIEDAWGCFPLAQGSLSYANASVYGASVTGRAAIPGSGARTYQTFPNWSGLQFCVGSMVSHSGAVPTGTLFGASSDMGGGEGLVLFTENPNRVAGQARTSGGSAYNVYAPSPSPANEWHLTVVEHAASGLLTIHRDATLAAATSASKPNNSLQPTRLIHVGQPNGNSPNAPLAFAFVAKGALNSSELGYLWNGGAGRTLAGILTDASYTLPAVRLTSSSTHIKVSYNGRKVGRRVPANNDTGQTSLNTLCTGKKWLAFKFHSLSGGFGYVDIDIGGTGAGALNRIYPGITNFPTGSASVGTAHGFSAAAEGDIWMFAVDNDAKKTWIGKNGTWSGDPAAGTGQLFNIPASTNLELLFELGAIGCAELLCETSEMPYSSPAGFTPWGD